MGMFEDMEKGKEDRRRRRRRVKRRRVTFMSIPVK
jgi:hypothetical protein